MDVGAVHIRDECADDIGAIRCVVVDAFADHPHSQQTEHCIIDALRAAGVLSLSLVAESDGAVVGHVAFSPVSIGDGSPGWYGLGPVAVTPAQQRRGIGRALIEAGLARLRGLGAAGCVVVGDPGYYGRFGFVASADLRYPGLPPEYFMALSLTAAPARGDVAYHAAFDVA
ncbi:GCN5 family acetyltransferase [Lysobacter sp. Root667]|uniref:GNAT family N-acetyltransferase n=1 Tax=Lysobacter sp. Root667 TaxID=1736581 RepID=UPI00070225CF|nr:N-acetyltransferase [Lysobacter sp. Root667]KRA75757.1 GCN5 family acetyltransferase [Lysobacter sp. Root667]